MQRRALLLASLMLLSGGSAALPGFRDVAREAGVLVQHAGEVHPELSAWPASPEVEGSGACWFDYDGDGLDDLYVVNQRWNPSNPAVGAWANGTDPTGRLFRNEGDGTFTDVTAQAGVEARIFGYGCSAADYDHDGCVDLFVSGFGAVRLYHNNCDGTFRDATASLHVPFRAPLGCGKWPCMSTSSAWADYNGDGWPDLYVGNYVNTNLTDTFRGPNGHVAQSNWLFRNNGDGTFTEVAADAGVAGSATDDHGSKTLGVAWFDYDLDGHPDLLVANDEEPVNLYHNRGDGTFTDEAVNAGIADRRANMGIAIGDYNRDGWPDVFLTHYQGELPGFYRNRGDGTFQDLSGTGDLNDTRYVGWGTAFADLDRDGWPDLLAANGHTEPQADYGQPVVAWRNAPGAAGARTWTDVTAQLGELGTKRVHRGMALSDSLLRGDLDIALVNNGNETNQLLHAALGGAGQGHWLDVQAVQAAGDRLALGARVQVRTPDGTQTREVMAGGGYLSQSSLTQRFGLGNATSADVTVRWPAGGSTNLTGLAADEAVRVRSDGTWTNDPVSPRTTVSLLGTAGQDGWWRSPVAVQVHAVDRGATVASGVVKTEVSVDGGAWAAPGPLSLGEGVHAVRARSLDAAGNLEPARTTTVPVDLTGPSVQLRVGGQAGRAGWWTSPSVQVALDARDALSGVAGLEARVDGGAWAPFTQPLVVAGDGVHRVDYAARDRAGNEARGGFDVPIDSAPPALAWAHPAPGSVLLGDSEALGLGAGPAVVLAIGPVQPRVDASDAASGVQEVRVSLDGAPLSGAWEAARAPAGLHVLRAEATDVAGNAASAELQVLVLPGTQDGALATLAQGPALHLALPGAP